MREILLLLGVVLTAFSLAGAESLKVDATRRGFLIKSENADITTMTSVIVCVPPFREKHFYNVTDDIDLVNTGDRAAIIQKGAKNKVDIVDYSVTREGDSLILSLVADLTHSDPTDMENTLLVTPEYLLSDADYTAVLADGSEVTGHIPPTFEGEIEVRHVFENAVKASFTNKYGTLTLEVLAGPPFLVGDRRGVVFEERRCFWIGHQVPMFEGKRYDSKDVRIRARAKAAAGSDARMSGCSLPVVINSGSGNQGLTVSLPVIEYGLALSKSDEEILRALAVSNLIAIHQKKYIGPLSAYCGAVSAAAGAAAGIAFISGMDDKVIADSITNTLASVGGIVCDGAKPSCAAKISSALEAAILGFELAEEKKAFENGEGLVKENVEKTIETFGKVGKEGMKETDIEILHLMIE